MPNRRLWEVLKEKGTSAEQSMVESLVGEAAQLLDLVRDTFPTYTLHNRIHAENIINQMEELLGDAIDQVTALEATILILGAYFHDIGMVFTESDFAQIVYDREFNEYLSKHPDDYVAFLRNDEKLTEEIAEGYCRWRHADRVYVHLDRMRDRLKWKSVPLRDKLGEVCRSHNQDSTFLQGPEFDPDFLGQCDLRFCAILLRLGDILDFDNSRSPKEVYDYLGIGRRDTPRRQRSDVEWLKHLCADGFIFPANRSDAYELGFAAGPKKPEVEHDLRQFLDVIESELTQCRTLLRFCSNRWRDHPFPGRINRKDIHSDGYKYGNFRFQLERESVLELFMGDKLYSDPMVFIRELLQNSVDATRVRSNLENIPLDDQRMAINIWSWRDHEGNDWVRIDDAGIGMDEEIVSSYLLKVGASYYNSTRFKADVLRHHANGKTNIVPISRFGIGILSCFIIGDQIEISTRRSSLVGEPSSKAIRISMSGLQNFFTLQVENMPALAMPAFGQFENGYRLKPGTSVAVRIDPSKYTSWSLTKEKLRQHVLAPSMPIYLNGTVIASPSEAVLELPWAQREDISLTEDQIEEVREQAGVDFDEAIFRIFPLDLTASSPSPLLKGQLVVGALDTRHVSSMVDIQSLLNIKEIDRDFSAESISLIENLIGWHATIASPDHNFARMARIEIKHRYEDESHFKSLLEAFRQIRREGRTFSHLLEYLSEDFYHQNKGRPYRIRLSKNGEKFLGLLERIEEHFSKDRYGPNSIIELKDFKKITGPLKVRTGASEELSLRLAHNHIDTSVLYESHHGIRHRLTLGDESPHRANNFLLYGAISLFDNLRPEVSISRDELKEMPFLVQSAINLALRRAFAKHRGTGCDHLINSLIRRISLIGPSESHISLAALEGDPLLEQADGWLAEPILKFKETEISILKLREDSNLVGAELGVIVGSYQFIDILRKTMIQLHLDVQCTSREGDLKIILASLDTPIQLRGLRFFPPLFFIPYSETTTFSSAGFPFNQRHALSSWFIEHADHLSRDRPAIFSALINSMRNISAKQYSFERSRLDAYRRNVEQLESLLGRIRTDFRAVPPPPESGLPR